MSATECTAVLSDTEKGKLVAEIKERVKQEAKHLENSIGACLQYAHHTADVINEYGIRALIQGGTMCWPRVTPEQDDGVSSTHFSYVWEPDSKTSRFALAFGALPEIHVWVGIPETNEIVDLTTGKFPEACPVLLGEPWLGPRPPDYLWQKGCPERVVYEANQEATLYALLMIFKRYNPSYLQDAKGMLEQVAKTWKV